MATLHRALLVATISISATAAADRAPSVDGVYNADEPVGPGENGPPECPAIATVKAGKLTFDFQAANHPKPLKFGTVSVALDSAGGFHGKATLPTHGKFGELGYQSDEAKARYRDLKEIQLDVDTIEVGGGGNALILKVTVPTGSGDGDYCQRTLVRGPEKPSGGGAFAGHYWLSAGTSKGWAVRCAGDAVIAGGKIYLTAANRYSSWAVTAKLAKNGSFEAEVPFAKMPADDVLRDAGYYDEVIKAVRGGLTLHITGSIENVHAVATGKNGKEITITAIDSDGFNKCEGHYYNDDFDVGGGFVNCDKLSSAQREMHPVCH